MIQKPCYAPIFNFSEFLDNSIISDCEIILDDGEPPIKAHKLILANSSSFFLNIFTAQMEESATGKVPITKNPGKLLRRVINWMYDGKIQYNDDNKDLLRLYEISLYYGVLVLNESLQKLIREKIKTEDILDYCDFCFNEELSRTLEFLAELIGENIGEFTDLEKLSQILDVKTFSLALKSSKLNTREKLQKISKFIGDYTMEGNDISDLKDALNKSSDKGTINKDQLKKEFPELSVLLDD
ncbi:BTB/POZ domain containing protein [Trichomonas vaginalis G3]|uniref:BTB/POZ domain containing protein n=1 Tax=Trichomonas vaginalis (strain ATCC PRA-98 / G3) TaxID=412133 RepID=A2ELK1_TRIV3|nr:protein ubiquitination [Trichomonas vaginalis G3]EAY06448.1 BTB/POZ domain containing protein [Trichomonas vaginalis G3]KAI5548024.1 protein ubiquitination [Trichomonas vaginalis G3]|eukprot:XP_001318671.1 BTB/POZ domain containing protein [Trichomonas vaginalis G3]